MPPSSAAARAGNKEGDHATEISDSDIDVSDDGPRREVIEEIQVMEEVEEESCDEGEDMVISPIRDYTDHLRNDFSKDKESMGHKRHLGSGSSSPEKSKVRLPSNILAVGENSGNFNSCHSNEPLTTQKDSYVIYEDFKYPKLGKQLAVAGEDESQESVVYKKDSEAFTKLRIPKNCSELSTECQSHLCHSEIIDASTAISFTRDGKKVAGVIPMREPFGERASSVFSSEDKTKKMDMQSGSDRKRVISRSATPEIKAQRLSPGVETKNGSKRPAIICNFYAKGWCIKGSSCKFLHVKDDVDNISQQLGRDVAAVNGKGEAKLEEVSNAVEISRSPNFRQLPSVKDDFGFRLPYLGGDSPRWNCPVDDGNNHASLMDRGSPRLKNSILTECRSSTDLAISSENYHSGSLLSYGSRLGDLSCIRSQYMANNQSSPVFSHSINPSFSTSQTSGIFPSGRFLTWTGSSFSPISSSLNASPLGTQKLFGSDKEYLTSQSSYLLRSFSPFSGLKSGRIDLSRDPPDSADHKTKISSDDWETSVPFQPSFFMTTASASSPGSQYDPLRDSIDQPNSGERSLKFFFSTSGTSIQNSLHQPAYGDSISAGAKVLDGNDDKSSVFLPNRFNDSVLDKNCCTPGKDSRTSGAETVGTSMVDGQNLTTPEGENPSHSLHAKDVPKSNKIDINNDSRHQRDGSRHKKESKLDRARQHNETGVEHTTDGETHKESKAMRHFRAALVDLVKELLKPTWHKGTLSKDAHIMIVKKAVDKVISTLQPNQIVNMESATQYLSFSRQKISKLVEAYAEKYGKS